MRTRVYRKPNKSRPGKYAAALMVFIFFLGISFALTAASAPSPGSSGNTGQPRTGARGTALIDPGQGAPAVSYPPIDDKAGYVSWMRAHSGENAKYLDAKWNRVQAIIKKRDAYDPRVIGALLIAPRELFVRAGSTSRAYEDAAMPIGYGQTISGPHLVARMTQALDPQPGQKVLEIGTGSGYQSAVLAELTPKVFTIEIVKRLAEETDAIYRDNESAYPEYKNITRKVADGYYGWPEAAPFDRIIVTCGIDHVPPELLRELAPDGVMVIPIGPPSGQTILKITRQVRADGTISFNREDIYHGAKKVIFVPFLSANGVHS